MNKKNIIIAVETALCHQLEGLKKMGGRFVSLPDNVAWENLEAKVPASLIITEKVEDKNTIYTATLKFLTPCTVDSREKRVFRLTRADGKQLLMGSDWRPYCMISVTENMPDRATDNQLNEVTVTFTNRWNIPFII